MGQIRLTDEAIRRIPLPEHGTAWYSFPSPKGLQLAVGRTKRTFYVVRWFKDRNVRTKIGEWCPPMFTAKMAEKAAEKIVASIIQGADPRAKTQGTLEEWLERYIATRTHASVDRLSHSTADQYRKAIKLYCRSWARRDLRNISEEDIAGLHRKMIKTPTAANQLVRVLRSIQRYAKLTPPPFTDWYKQRRRENGVKPDSRKAFGQMILSIASPIRRAVWLLGCYTGIRRESLCDLQWGQVDLDAATLHLPKMKNKHARTMPLSPQALAVLRSLKGRHSKWVFPSPASSASGRINEVRDKAISDEITFHDTRRLFTEAGGECLIPEYAIAYLRGDVVNQSMSQRYMSHLDLRGPIKTIGRHIEAQLFPKPKRKTAAPKLKLAA